MPKTRPHRSRRRPRDGQCLHTDLNVVPPNRLPGDDGQILIVHREDVPNGRTVCIIPGSLLYLNVERDFVRLLDEQDLENARLFAAAPRLRAVLTDLIEWAARSGSPEAPCWHEARALATILRTPVS
jgi:hypothetical protein